MRRLLLGILIGASLGVALGQAAHGQDIKPFAELEMQTIRGVPFTLPKEYGKLVDVVVDSAVHYLYFEDRSGSLRIVLIGPRSAVTKTKSVLQLLSQDVVLVKRERPAE